MVTLTGTVMAQGFYFRAGGTYGLPVGTTVIGSKYNYTYNGSGASPVTTASTKAISASYGAGPNFAVAVGYKFNQNFMFDLTGQYLIGNKYKTGSVSNYIYSTYSTVSRNLSDMQVKGFFLNPSFIFSAGFGKAAPYGRFGVVIGSPQLTTNESSYDNTDGISSFDRTWIYKKGLALGYQAAIGMNWKLSEKLDIYTEVNILNMTWYAQQGQLTKFIDNGTNALVNLSVSQKQIEFKKSYDPSVQYNPAKPTVQLREATPLSSISAQVGIRFTMFQKKAE